MTLKQISTLHYILGRMEGMAEGINNQRQQQYLQDICKRLAQLLREEEEVER